MRQVVREARTAGQHIGFVPTMGAFHDGHRALMRAARVDGGLVVASLFVNPAQFGPNEDLAAYPRDEKRDADLARDAGVDVLFAPTASEIYPGGFATTIHITGVTEILCGAVRGAEHFDGVATVVTKLFTIVQPDTAYFGQKDAQQVVVIRRLVRDLNLDVRIVACPIVREDDGLAMSSRNVYLTPSDRRRATALNAALTAANAAFATGERNTAALLSAARRVLDADGISPEYLELRRADDLAAVGETVTDEAILAVAARVGAARLIDNRTLGGDA
ncbi:pantoate--beta-alanine ligase [Microbacterium amylolyticum]